MGTTNRPSRRLTPRWLLALALTAALPLPTAQAAEMTQELRDEVRTAENDLRVLEKTKGADPAELIGLRGRLARLYMQAQWRKKADELFKKIVDGFAKAGLAKTGGPEAAFAAEAQFHMLDARYQAAMQSKPAFGKGGKAAEQLAAQIRKMRTEIAGEELPAEAGGIADRKGGLCGDYTTLVASYRAYEWIIAAAIAQSRLLAHVAEAIHDIPLPADQAADEKAQFRQIVDEQSRDFDSQALRLLEAAWAELGRRNLDTPWKQECRRDLNKYLPKQYPLSRQRADQWLSPVPESLQAQLKQSGLFDDLQSCYDRHLAAVPDDLLGGMNVQFELRPDGTANVGSVDHANSALIARCLTRKWSHRNDFPKVEAPTPVSLKLEYAAL
ncbi:MAG: hypothetical protein HY902_02965 [Deltaproteobacteria bacterium]|nr:hypothetical protein [Deltaproteobacteria bacterium]